MSIRLTQAARFDQFVFRGCVAQRWRPHGRIRRRVVVVGAGIGGLVAALLLATRRLRGHGRRSARRARRQDARDRRSAAWRSTPARPSSPCAGCSTRSSPPPAPISADHVEAAPSRDPGAPCLERRRAARPLRRSRRAAPTPSATSPAAEKRDGFARFCARARGESSRRCDDSFIRAHAAEPARSRAPRRRCAACRDSARISPFATLWDALGKYFHDPRLRQLFGRYATYCGSSPFAAPATLMLVAHVEQDGVWLVEGGMHRLARRAGRSRAERAARVSLRAKAPRRSSSRAAASRGVDARDRRDRSSADAVVFNGDAARAAAPDCSATPRSRRCDGAPRRASRSLSAVTWAMRARDARLSARPPHRVLLARLPRANSTTSSATSALPRRADGLCLRAGSRRRRRARLRTARAPVRARQRAGRRRRARLSTRGDYAMRGKRPFDCSRDCGLDIQAPPQAIARTTPSGLRAAVPGDGRRALRPGVARLDGVVHAAGSADEASGSLSRGRQRASGAGRADGGAVGPARGAASDGGPRFDAAVRAERLCLVVCRCAERRRPIRPDRHRLHRQRVLALLRLVGMGRPASIIAPSTSRSTGRAARAGR